MPFLRLVGKAKALGYQFALHATNTDGYMCSRLWNPEWVCKRADGTFDKGGLWAGGQCYWVCQKYAWEHWLPEEMKEMAALGIRGPHYIDVYSATYPQRCGDPRHPCTPEQTAAYQNRILAEGRRLMGGAASESGYDHVAANLDYINYIERDLQLLEDGKQSGLVAGVYPLWELVYHGIILYTSDRWCQNHTRGKCLYKLEKSGDPRWMEGDGVENPRAALKNIEFGGRPIFYTYKFADVPRIKKAWEEFAPVRHLQRELMTRHDELAPDVYRTSFEDGSQIVSNYGETPYLWLGQTVRPLGYVLKRPDGSFFQPAPFVETPGTATLRNRRLELDFADAAHGFALKSIVCLDTNASFVEETGDCGFWEITLRSAVDGSFVTLNGKSACRARRVIPTRGGGICAFAWEGLALPGEPDALTVRATVRLTEEGESRWSLDVQNDSVNYALWETRYPILRRVAAEGTADVLLPRPDLGAKLVRNRIGKEDLSFGCHGYYPMMTAFFKGDAGLYIAAHDSQGRLKTLEIAKDNTVSFRTPVENAGLPGRAAEGPRYEVTVAALAGDWWQAAKRYRRWALTAPWTAKGRILDRRDYPRRLAEIPLWLNTHASPEEVSNTLAQAKARFPNHPVGIHWHLWQHSPHDVNYPEYFPEQPGTRECLAYCRRIGAEAMPYVNGRLWSTNLVGFALARPSALTQADGTPYVEQYGNLTPPMAPMCPWSPAWNEILPSIASRVLELGTQSLFMDQIGACAGVPCYSPSHGHPTGGGTWYYDGYQALLARIHAQYARKGAFLTVEGSGEQWMNVIDGYLQVTQRTPQDVPFFHAVYSGYTTYFCSPENHEDDIDSFWAAQARELVWGQALGWYHPLILQDAEKCALVRRLTEFRQAHLDCFAYGTLEGELTFLDAVKPVPVTWLGRKQFYMWKVKDAPLSPTVRGELPGVAGYVWKSGATGELRAALANLSGEPHTVRFVHEGREYRVALAPRELKMQDL